LVITSVSCVCLVKWLFTCHTGILGNYFSVMLKERKVTPSSLCCLNF